MKLFKSRAIAGRMARRRLC